MDGIFALGSNGSGQLGLGHKEDVSVPKQVQFSQAPQNDPITQVAAGGNHTILITASGKAYSSGNNISGCCGVNDEEDKGDNSLFRPFCVPNWPIVHATCTWDTTIFVTGDKDGRATRIYSCGGASEGLSGEPILVSDFPPAGTAVTCLAAGFRHVLVVLDNGDVYGWGNGKKGQLGQREDVADADASSVVTRPGKISGVPFRVAKVVCCQYSTCLIAEPGDGRILVLGADKWKLRSDAPTEVPNWKVITASWGSIYILKRDGKIEAWGRDDHGQLPPPGIPEIAHIVAGSEHAIALTDTGDVLAWGWGEHGNCGPHADERFGDVKGRWNVLASLKNLPQGSSITAIGAGCATSWINIMAEGVFL